MKKSDIPSFEIIQMAIAHGLEDYRDIADWSVQNWLNYGFVPPELSHLPAAIEAKKILNSPLYEALNEEEED